MIISFSNGGQVFPFSPVYGKFDALRMEWILRHSRDSQGKKPFHLLAMVMLSQWNALITCEGTNVCLCLFDFP